MRSPLVVTDHSGIDSSILDPVRRVGVGTQATPAIRFVVLVVALEPLDVAVAFEGEDVGRDAVEEPSIVADDDRAAREVDQRILEAALGMRK